MQTGRYEITRRASLELLRAEAEDERSTMVYGRLRRGEDPWQFMQELPTVDELVVLLLREETISESGHRPDRLEDAELLTAIAAEYPPLSSTVQGLLSGRGAIGARWVR